MGSGPGAGQGVDGTDSDDLFVVSDGSGAEGYFTLCWTDPPGTIRADNEATPVLVHDLDMRARHVTANQDPWKLNRTNYAARAAFSGSSSI